MKNFDLNLNNWGLLGSTLVTLVTTWYWFGPLFGETINNINVGYKAHGEGKSGFKKFPVMFIQQGVLNTALAISMQALLINNIPDLLILSIYIWLGFVAVLLLDNLVWGQSNKIRFLISSSHRLIVIIQGALVYHLLAN